MTSLPKAFDFTPDELADNRAGRLSGAQRDALMKALGRTLDRQRPLPIVGLTGLVIAIGLGATVIVRGIDQASLAGWPLIGLALLAAIGASILIARRTDPQPDDPAAVFDALIRDDRIEALRGLVRFEEEGLRVGGEKVSYLIRPAHGAAVTLSADRRYIVYTIEIDGTRLLLSMEESEGFQDSAGDDAA